MNYIRVFDWYHVYYHDLREKARGNFCIPGMGRT